MVLLRLCKIWEPWPQGMCCLTNIVSILLHCCVQFPPKASILTKLLGCRHKYLISNISVFYCSLPARLFQYITLRYEYLWCITRRKVKWLIDTLLMPSKHTLFPLLLLLPPFLLPSSKVLKDKTNILKSRQTPITFLSPSLSGCRIGMKQRSIQDI